MNGFKCRFFIIWVFLLIYSLGISLVEAKSPINHIYSSKMSALLRMLVTTRVNSSSSSRSFSLQNYGVSNSMVDVFIKGKNLSFQVKRVGGEIGSTLGDIVTARVPIDSLLQLAASPDIKYIEESIKEKPLLDKSIPETKVNTFRTRIANDFAGFTGKGVIIGIVDTGIDWTHDDFIGPSGSRILYLLDQSNGREWTKLDFDSGRGPTSMDSKGHGTHVAGIATGDGSATGNNYPNFRYIGVAPEADIIFVKNKFYRKDIVDGINYIKDKARAEGKKVVVNLSLGSHLGPHDGTSLYEQSIDWFSLEHNIPIVVAAGNTRDSKIHASGTLSQFFNEKSVEFTISSGVNSVLIDVWYGANDRIAIQVIAPNNNKSPVVEQGQSDFFEMDGKNIAQIDTVDSLGIDDPLAFDYQNNDHRILISIPAVGMNYDAAPGKWKLRLIGRDVENGYFDAWIATVYPLHEEVIFENADDDTTIEIPGTAQEVITVAAYGTKNEWIDLNGNPQDYSGIGVALFGRTLFRIGFTPILGEIAFFSSKGPVRGNKYFKPDIAAPGFGVVSVLSGDANVSEKYRVEDGKHYISQGTSMAAPHVTGAIALILQASPNNSPQNIKGLLQSNSRVDSFVGSAPNFEWGFGKLDLSILSQIPLPTESLTVTVKSY